MTPRVAVAADVVVLALAASTHFVVVETSFPGTLQLVLTPNAALGTKYDRFLFQTNRTPTVTGFKTDTLVTTFGLQN